MSQSEATGERGLESRDPVRNPNSQPTAEPRRGARQTDTENGPNNTSMNSREPTRTVTINSTISQRSNSRPRRLSTSGDTTTTTDDNDAEDRSTNNENGTEPNRDDRSFFSSRSKNDKSLFRTYTENMHRALWETILPDELKHAHIIAKYCPLVAAIAAPLSTLLDIPALTQHWYTLDGVAQSDPKACLGLSAAGLALNIFANILLILRFSSRTPFWWRMGTKLSLIFWLAKTIVAAVNLIVFGIATRNGAGYSYAEGFWCAVVSICDSGIISFALLFHYFFAFGRPQFDKQDIRLQGRKFMLSVTALIAIIALQALAFCKIEHWAYLDSIYFSIQTALTIGYGDFVPTTTAGKVLVFPFSVLAISQLGNEIAMIVSFIADRANQRRDKWRKRYERAIHREANRLRPNATLTEEMALIHHINKREETMSQAYDLMWSAFALIVFWVCGAAIFSSLEGWTYGNTIYAVMILSLTIGFGDFTPKTEAGRVVWVVYALMAVPIVTSFAVQTITGILSTWSEHRFDRERFMLERDRHPQAFSSHSEVVQKFHDLYDRVRTHIGGEDSDDEDGEKKANEDRDSEGERVQSSWMKKAKDDKEDETEETEETEEKNQKDEAREGNRKDSEDNWREGGGADQIHQEAMRSRTKSGESSDSRTIRWEGGDEPAEPDHDFKHGDADNEDKHMDRNEAKILEDVRRVQEEDEERISEGGGEDLVGDGSAVGAGRDGVEPKTGVKGGKKHKQTEAEHELDVDLLRQLVNRTIQLEAEARQMLLDSMDKGLARTLLLADRNVQIRDVNALRGDDANMVAIWRGEEDRTDHDARKRQKEHPEEADTEDDDMLSRVRRYRNTFAEILVISSILQRLEGEEQSRFERWRTLEDAASALSGEDGDDHDGEDGAGADADDTAAEATAGHHPLRELHGSKEKGEGSTGGRRIRGHAQRKGSRDSVGSKRNRSSGSLFGLSLSRRTDTADTSTTDPDIEQQQQDSSHNPRKDRGFDLDAIAEDKFSGLSGMVFKHNAKAIYKNATKDSGPGSRWMPKEGGEKEQGQDK